MSKPMRIALITSVGLVTLVLAVVFATRFGSDPRLSPSPLIGKPAPEVLLDLAESDETLALTDLLGDVVVVNFWAPWCVPCRAEHADLIELATTYGDLGVSLLGIAYQSREDNVTTFLDELGRGYPTGMDDRSRAAIGFGVRGVPETYFIDRDGTVVAKITGPIEFGLAAATLDSILLGKSVDSTTTGDVQQAP